MFDLLVPNPKDDHFSSRFKLVAFTDPVQGEFSSAQDNYTKIAFTSSIKGSHYVILVHVSMT